MATDGGKYGEAAPTLRSIVDSNAGCAIDQRNDRSSYRTVNACLNAYYRNVLDTCKEYGIPVRKAEAWDMYVAAVRTEAMRLNVHLYGRYEHPAPAADTVEVVGTMHIGEVAVTVATVGETVSLRIGDQTYGLGSGAAEWLGVRLSVAANGADINRARKGVR